MSLLELCQCKGKEPMSLKVAKRAADRIRKSKGGAVTHYRCQYCGQWHVGSMPPKTLRGVRA